MKEEKNVRAFAYLLGGEFDELVKLLQAEDPKIRKNAALILGKMESEDLLPVLFDAYKAEKTLFVRADYLKAISEMDYRPLLCELEQRLETLRSYETCAEEEKHIAKERRILQQMVMKYRRTRRHRFTGYDVPSELILVTNRCQREAQLTRYTDAGSLCFRADCAYTMQRLKKSGRYVRGANCFFRS